MNSIQAMQQAAKLLKKDTYKPYASVMQVKDDVITVTDGYFLYTSSAFGAQDGYYDAKLNKDGWNDRFPDTQWLVDAMAGYEMLTPENPAIINVGTMAAILEASKGYIALVSANGKLSTAMLKEGGQLLPAVSLHLDLGIPEKAVYVDGFWQNVRCFNIEVLTKIFKGLPKAENAELQLTALDKNGLVIKCSEATIYVMPVMPSYITDLVA
jgi:hypothetical protein